jgi:hypothetical protein
MAVSRILGRAVAPLFAAASVMAWACGTASAASASGWAVQRLPVPSSAQTFPLSCSSSTACTAVATFYPFPSAEGDVLFAARWNGQAWSREVMAEPAGSSSVLIGGISCPSESFCVAVGGSTSAIAGRYVPLAESWNGAMWSIESIPAGPGVSSRLSSVSCTSPLACTAVGESVSRTPKRPVKPLVERWNGTRWSLERARGGSLISVSCTSHPECTAIGNTANRMFAEGWDGGRWSTEPNPHPRGFGGPNGDNELNGVSCASRDACTAVGYSTWGSGFGSVRLTLAEHWNGSRWSLQSTPNPIQLDELKSVSCSSGSSCIAVGDYTGRAGDATRALIEWWRDGRWSVLPTPRRLSTGKSSDSALQAVSCFTDGTCIATGDAEGGPFATEFQPSASRRSH